MAIQTKTCRTCGKTKPLSAFPRRKGALDGCRNECRDCQKAYNADYYQHHSEVIRANSANYYREHQEEQAAKQVERYRRNRTAILARCAEYRASHSQETKARSERYYREHRDDIIAKVMAWQRAHRDHRREYVSRWRKTKVGRHSRIASQHTRRAKLGGMLSRKVVTQVIAASGGICPYCNEPIEDGHIDHIVPVSFGGTNTMGNLAYVCARCNIEKSNMSLLTFLLERRVAV